MKGIYKFECKSNGKVYVGQSINIEERYKSHKNNHTNKNTKDYSTKFYRALRKHGFENFVYEVLEQTEDEGILEEKEKYWIAYYNSFKEGYNSTPGGDVTGVGKNILMLITLTKRLFN